MQPYSTPLNMCLILRTDPQRENQEIPPCQVKRKMEGKKIDPGFLDSRIVVARPLSPVYLPCYSPYIALVASRYQVGASLVGPLLVLLLCGC